MLHRRCDLTVADRHLRGRTKIATLEPVNIERRGRRILGPSDLNGQRQRLTERCALRMDSGVDTHLGSRQGRTDKAKQQAQGGE